MPWWVQDGQGVGKRCIDTQITPFQPPTIPTGHNTPARTHTPHTIPFSTPNRYPVVRLCRYDKEDHLPLHYRTHTLSLYAPGQHIQRVQLRRVRLSSLIIPWADPGRSGPWAVSGHTSNRRTCTQNTTCDVMVGSGRSGSWDTMHRHPNNTFLTSNHAQKPQTHLSAHTPHTQSHFRPKPAPCGTIVSI